jgi:hypothetical protein
MLIRAYGQFWNPDIVEWGKTGKGNKGRLLGKARINGTSYEVDFWDSQGVYVLHADFKAVYVGKADSQRLGPRLRDHLSDRFAGRWDMFSWFSQSTVAVTYGGVRKPGRRSVTAGTVNNTLEALLILVTDPALNRKREKLPDAIEVEQKKGQKPKAIRTYLEEILKKVGK